jgi:hypothetical protein
MASVRAGRTTTPITSFAPVTPVPRRALHVAGNALTRRRAALAHVGHAAADLSGIDGDVCVRYEAVYRRAEPASGERRLLLAVLEDGIRTFLKYARATHGRAANLRREAYGWLTADDRRDVFAFGSICETLGIDAGRLRRRVLAQGLMSPVLGRPMH